MLNLEKSLNEEESKINNVFLRLFLINCFISLSLFLFSQKFDSSFKMLVAADQSIELGINITNTIQLKPFVDLQKISGLSISADIKLNSDSSMVRVVLIDSNFNEYLVYEAYLLLTEKDSFSIDEIGEETVALNNIIPVQMEIEIIDATIYLKEIAITKEEEFMAMARSSILQQQQSDKIRAINNNIQRKGLKWIAGETPVSMMTYQEKKNMFGGKIPNLQGFEYYKGGIFVLSGTSEENTNTERSLSQELTTEESPFVKEFSWRNRHGQDWITPVRNQGGCGSCWAFAVTGATEVLVNLYYNQHLDINLSEQDVLSCSGAGSCSGGYSYSSIDYIINTGIVDETCFSYNAQDIQCSEKCSTPNEQVKISSKSYNSTENNKKSAIIKSATAASVPFWSHAMTLIGYKVLEKGDTIYLNNNGTLFWVVIPENDPLIGQTAWLFKNSWGESFGDEGYVYVVGRISVYGLYGPVYSMNYFDSDIQCVDSDDDGYYNWGIGPKPSHCPDCPDEPDGDE